MLDLLPLIFKRPPTKQLPMPMKQQNKLLTVAHSAPPLRTHLQITRSLVIAVAVVTVRNVVAKKRKILARTQMKPAPVVMKVAADTVDVVAVVMDMVNMAVMVVVAVVVIAVEAVVAFLEVAFGELLVHTANQDLSLCLPCPQRLHPCQECQE